MIPWPLAFLSSEYTQAVCLKHVSHLSFMYNGSGQAKCYVCLRDVWVDYSAAPINHNIIADYYTLHDMYFMICRRRQIWMIDSWCWRCQRSFFPERTKKKQNGSCGHLPAPWLTKATKMDDSSLLSPVYTVFLLNLHFVIAFPNPMRTLGGFYRLLSCWTWKFSWWFELVGPALICLKSLDVDVLLPLLFMVNHPFGEYSFYFFQEIWNVYNVATAKRVRTYPVPIHYLRDFHITSSGKLCPTSWLASK